MDKFDRIYDLHRILAGRRTGIPLADLSDLGTKVQLYARAGIPEAWVIDLQERAARVFRDPSPSGYRTSFTGSGEDSIVAGALPEVVIAVSKLFPS